MTRQRTVNHALAFIDPFARGLSRPLPWTLYTAYPLTTAEYVGRYPDDRLSRAVSRLRDAGYTANPLAAAKYHPAPHRAVDHGSYRRVPDAHPEGIDARITREYAPNQCHYHCHLWPVTDGVEVYSHYEVRPDILRGDFDPWRMAEHYRPELNETYLPGVTDLSP